MICHVCACTPIYVLRIYGDKAPDIIDGLKKSPAVAMPIVLKRWGGREGGSEGERGGRKEGGREGERGGGKEGGREGGEGGREGEREGGREGRREGGREGREGGREGECHYYCALFQAEGEAGGVASCSEGIQQDLERPAGEVLSQG